jgi:MerR family transcriptional regulator, light-induced transcriptional regulator
VLVKLLSKCCIVGQVSEAALLRIGELSRRSGVSPELLRAWERRYDLLQPKRSDGGLRLYTEADLERVRAMQRHLATGLAAAEAARLASSNARAADPAVSLDAARGALAEAFADFDEARAQALLDSLFAGTTLDAALSRVVVPYLHELGERWEAGDATVAEEHFASGVLRGRLLGLARGWGRGLGPRVALACAPGEQHDLGLIAFGLALRARGWRVAFLGQDTPLESLAGLAFAFGPEFVVLSSVDPKRFERHADELRELAETQRLCLAAAGAADAKLDVDALRLVGDPVEEAERLTELVSR